MHPMRDSHHIVRWVIFCVLAALLLVCAAMWVRGYFRDDWMAFSARHAGHFRRWACENVHGVVLISYEHQTPNSRVIVGVPNGWDFQSNPAANLVGWPDPVDQWHGIPIGFCKEYAYAALFSAATPGFGDHMDHNDFTRYLWFPPWLPTFVLTGLILWLFLRGRRRAPPGFCKKCGYDLRATPDRCPECGTLVSGKG